MRPFLSSVPQSDLEVFDAAGFGQSIGPGERPAVLVIDVQYRTTGDRPAPRLDAIATMYRTACGDSGWRAVHDITRLLEAGRRSHVPIIYPYVARKDVSNGSRFADKLPSITDIPDAGYAFVAEVEPEAGDLLIPKDGPSAFYGTSLLTHLIDRKIDSLIVTGATTSGCVRATVVDAFSRGFRTAVVESCVFDRFDVSHDVALFDMHAKYADVITLDDAIGRLDSIGDQR